MIIPNMFIQAPYPQMKGAIELPQPTLGDGKASESEVQVKRTMLGRIITYPKTSEKQTLRLQFELTRMKDIELDRFLLNFHYGQFLLEIPDENKPGGYAKWAADLSGAPIQRTGAGSNTIENNPLTGREFIRVTLVFSATELN